jgi:hypothetical protein
MLGLCHFIGLKVFGVILHKICVQNINADSSDLKKKNSGNSAETKKSALISLVRQKWFGVNIFVDSALIFSALVTCKVLFWTFVILKTEVFSNNSKKTYKRLTFLKENSENWNKKRIKTSTKSSILRYLWRKLNQASFSEVQF